MAEIQNPVVLISVASQIMCRIIIHNIYRAFRQKTAAENHRACDILKATLILIYCITIVVWVCTYKYGL